MAVKALYFLLAGVLLFCQVPGACAANMLANPGFEDGDFPPSGWSDWSGSSSGDPKNGVAGFPAPQEMARTGSRCAGKIFYGRAARWGGFSQAVETSSAQGKAFEANVWVTSKRNDAPLANGARVYLEVKFLDGGEKEIKVVKSGMLTQPSNWVKLTARGTVPKNAAKAVFSLVMTGGDRSAGKALFDDANFNVGR